MDDLLAEHWRRFRAEASEANFQPIYEATNRLVWTICIRVLGEESDARDAFQAVYTRLLAEARDPACGSDAVALAGRLAGLEADALRKRRARLARREVKAMEDSDAIAGAEHITRGLAQAQLRALLERETARLEEDLRVAVELHFLDGLTQREVAGVLGLSVSTVNDRIQRALERLRPLLRRAGIERVEDALPMLLPLAVLLVPPGDLKAASVFAGASASSIASSSSAATAGSSSAALAWLWKIAATLVVLTAIVATFAVSRSGRRPSPAPEPQAIASAAMRVPSQPAAPAARGSRPAGPAPASTPLAASPTPRGAGELRVGGVLEELGTGRPLAGIPIRLFPGKMGPSGQLTTGLPGTTQIVTTSASGEFVFEGLDAASYLLFADSDAYRILESKSAIFHQSDLTDGRSQPNLKLEAWPGVEVSGTVFDVSTGKLLEGVRVRSVNSIVKRLGDIWGEKDRPWHETVAMTGADGRYLIRAFGEPSTVSRGDVRTDMLKLNLWYDKDGYTSSHSSYPDLGVLMQMTQVSPETGAIVQDFRLAPSVDVHVAVVDEAGAPVANAEVGIERPISQHAADELTRARTDELGRAMVRVGRGMQTTLSATADGFAPGEVSGLVQESNAAEPLRLALKSLGGKRLRFRVLDDLGQPVSRGQFKLVLTLSFPSREQYPKWRGDVIEFDGFHPARLEAGMYRLDYDGGGRYEPLKRPVTAEDFGDGEPATIVLKRLVAEFHVAGTIRGEDGNPLAGAEVFVPELDFQTATDSEGRYSLDVPRETTLLGVRHPDLGVSGIRALHEGEGNDLDWRHANTIAEVHLFNSQTKLPITEFTVNTSDTWSQHAIRDESRRNVVFVEQGIRPGRIEFTVLHPEGSSVSPSIAIPEGEILFQVSHEMMLPKPRVEQRASAHRIIWMAGS